MNSFKKTLFVFLAFTVGKTISVSFPTRTVTAALAITANTSVAQCSAPYSDEATQKLWHAIVKDDLIAAQKAIDEGANPNGTSQEDFLLLATKLNRLFMIKLLILHKADVNTKCKISGQTSLIIACIYGLPEITAALLIEKADYTLRDKEYDRNALEWAEAMEALHTGTEKEITYLRCKNLIRKKMFHDKFTRITQTKK